jgi:hypothetical protein
MSQFVKYIGVGIMLFWTLNFLPILTESLKFRFKRQFWKFNAIDPRKSFSELMLSYLFVNINSYTCINSLQILKGHKLKINYLCLRSILTKLPSFVLVYFGEILEEFEV